uniref:hypothetical protein n=1 Tax=Okeania sp. SIO2F4 TaxID=2607790 RepID=UPI0025EAF535|nr:hypothetical protein [Okeania sp. SIO2F4]
MWICLGKNRHENRDSSQSGKKKNQLILNYGAINYRTGKVIEARIFPRKYRRPLAKILIKSIKDIESTISSPLFPIPYSLTSAISLENTINLVAQLIKENQNKQLVIIWDGATYHPSQEWKKY